MSNTNDNDLELPGEGQADWDSVLNANFGILERGYHTKARAGSDISSGRVCALDGDGFMQLYDPNSLDSKPHAFCFTAPSSGDEITFLLAGIVRSLDVYTPGVDYFVSPVTPGMIVSSYSAAHRKIGYGVADGGIRFQPTEYFCEELTKVTTIVINPSSEHLFTMDMGKRGVIRDLLMKSDSLDFVGLAFFSNSARDNLLYQVISGGVTTVSSFVDRALWPYENTDASTLSGLIYGKVFADSAATISSGAVQIQLKADRYA